MKQKQTYYKDTFNSLLSFSKASESTLLDPRQRSCMRNKFKTLDKTFLKSKTKTRSIPSPWIKVVDGVLN